MPKDPRVAVKGIASLALSNLPHLGFLPEIKLIVHVVAVVGVHDLEGVPIVSSNYGVIGFCKSIPILQDFCLE
jgi:hypothetical protein